MSYSNEEIIKIIAHADKMWNVLALSLAFAEIQEKNPDFTYADAERCLREIGSKTTYLVALPADSRPKNTRVLKLTDLTPANFHLWICLNGQQEMIDMLYKFEITIQQNLINLKETGVLIKEEGVLAKA